MGFINNRFNNARCKQCGKSLEAPKPLLGVEGERCYWTPETGALCLKCHPEPDPNAITTATAEQVALAEELGFE